MRIEMDDVIWIQPHRADCFPSVTLVIIRIDGIDCYYWSDDMGNDRLANGTLNYGEE